MKDKILKGLFLVQERITMNGSKGKRLERRINPYNPLVYIFMILTLLVFLVVDIFKSIAKNIKEIFDFKDLFGWAWIENIPIELISKTFYKESNGDWFIDLPEYIEQGGTKSELQMVCGADTMLDVLSQGEDTVRVTFATEDIGGCKYQLHLRSLDYIGAEQWGNYKAPGASETYPEIDTVMLCPVTKFVFNGDFPLKIYVG